MAIELKTTDAAGKPVGKVSLDEQAFGGKIKPRLIHSAAVMYHTNTRQGSACTKTRAEISGTTKKLYRQKGTGRARAGSKKSGTRIGGGVIHGPKPKNWHYQMPQKQRRAALRSAILGKAKDGELHVLKGIDFKEPKTKNMTGLLEAHGLGGDTVLVATEGLKRNVFLSGRNIRGVTVIPAAELNTRAVLVHKHLLIDEKAFGLLNAKREHSKPSRKPKGTRKAKPPGKKRRRDKAKATRGEAPAAAAKPAKAPAKAAQPKKEEG